MDEARLPLDEARLPLRNNRETREQNSEHRELEMHSSHPHRPYQEYLTATGFLYRLPD
jgi:hypothetical protein